MRAILLVVALWLSGCSMIPANKYLAPALPDIKRDVAKEWQRQCENYFFWRTPTVVAYRGGSSHELLTPTSWCYQESMVFLRDQLPHDYKRNIDKRR